MEIDPLKRSSVPESDSFASISTEKGRVEQAKTLFAPDIRRDLPRFGSEKVNLSEDIKAEIAQHMPDAHLMVALVQAYFKKIQ